MNKIKLPANDKYNLMRFVEAQENSYEIALNEVRSGRKVTHWMWFIFPQIEGLGNSQNSHMYAIKTKDEALDYLKHPLLGKRLKLITKMLFNHTNKKISDIFPDPDDLKLQSSMTLFSKVNYDKINIFEEVLKRFFDGKPDQNTLDRIKSLY